jgi:hypothetical protein
MRLTLSIFFVLGMTVVSWADEKPRVFITDSKSWEISGGFAAGNGAAGGGTRGGARPQTAEIMKTFGQRCPQVTVTMKQEKADYVVMLDHEGGKGWGRRDNKVAVFKKDGDMLFSGSTRSLGNSVQDACEAIIKGPPANEAGRAIESARLPESIARGQSPTTPPSSPRAVPDSVALSLGVTGIATEEGFKITSVREGSLASHIFLARGDTITKVADKVVASAQEVDAAIAASVGNSVEVTGLTKTSIGRVKFVRELKIR